MTGKPEVAAAETAAPLLVLAEDVAIVAVAALSQETRAAVAGSAGDHVVTRELGRQSSVRIDREAAEFLGHFRTPTTLLAAVVSYCEGKAEADAFEVLEGAYPLVARLRAAGFLTGAEEADRDAIRATHAADDVVHGTTIVECVHILEDTEVYRAIDADGRAVALKILRPRVHARTVDGLVREVTVRTYLDTLPTRLAPQLLRAALDVETPYMISAWHGSRHVATAAAALRAAGDPAARRALHDLVLAVATVFADLHEAGVVHGDVHPKNVLVADDQRVTLVDFAGARRLDEAPPVRASRAGLPLFYEPELALALLSGVAGPHPSAAGEQYAVATLVYLLLTGSHPIALSFERETAYRQLVETAPRSFAEVGAEPWPAVEATLSRALDKQASSRFPSLRAFALALQKALDTPARAAGPDGPAAGALQAVHEAPPRPTGGISATYAKVVGGLIDRYGLGACTGADGALPLSCDWVAPTASVYYGAAGLAYALLRIAALRGDPAILAAADLWISHARSAIGTDDAFVSESLNVTPASLGPAALLHAAPGVHLVDALIRTHADDDIGAFAAARRMLGSLAVERGTDIELSMGESGVLMGLATLHEALAPLANPEMLAMIRAQGDTVCDRIWSQLGPSPDTGAAALLRFLGLAHGWAGVYHATLRWCRATGGPPPAALRDHLAFLAKLGVQDGVGIGWPISPPANMRVWPGWCHGSAGHMLLWGLAWVQYREVEFLELAQAAAEHSWARRGGIGPTLCCGLAGQGLAMLVLARQADLPQWRARAHSLALAAANSRLVAQLVQDGPTTTESRGNEPLHSLFKGAVGAALLVAEVESSGVPAWPLCTSWH